MLYVRDLMTTDVDAIDVGDDLNFAQSMMALGRYHHLPVMRAGRLAGILSCRDICRSKASDVRTSLTAAQLEKAYTRIAAEDMMTYAPTTISPDAPASEAAALLREGPYSCLPVLDSDLLVGIVTTSDFLDAFIRSGFMEQVGASIVLRAAREPQIPWTDEPRTAL